MTTEQLVMDAKCSLGKALDLILDAKFNLVKANHMASIDAEKVRAKLLLLIKKLK
jgi:hypothetical protein